MFGTRLLGFLSELAPERVETDLGAGVHGGVVLGHHFREIDTVFFIILVLQVFLLFVRMSSELLPAAGDTLSAQEVRNLQADLEEAQEEIEVLKKRIKKLKMDNEDLKDQIRGHNEKWDKMFQILKEDTFIM